MSPQKAHREHDVVVYGATGFVGRLSAAYLAASAPAGARIALAGRSREKLERTRRDLGGAAAEWPLLVADSADRSALDDVVRATRVVATTVGPYQRYGMALVQACAAAGTHYADLTGETLFMRRTIDECDSAATDSGARIVHSCGFDSIPSDMGMHLLHARAREDGLGDLGDTTLVVCGMRGGPSGGTIDSIRVQVDEARRDPSRRRLLADPYALSPARDREPDLGPEADPSRPSHDPQLGGWLAPFVMGMVNTRVVRRSNALVGYAYGSQLRYRELVRMGEGPLGPLKAAGMSAGLVALQASLSLAPTRPLLDRLLPKPGEGPSEAARDRGFFRIETHTRTSSGQRIVCRIAAQGDPGYKATAVMLGESALALAFDEQELPSRAGVLTPATGIGDTLVRRLRAAGHSYDVELV
jgi:short subunit dehydrogenase-like uncharacterized protein